jgi:hypothetical protein
MGNLVTGFINPQECCWRIRREFRATQNSRRLNELAPCGEPRYLCCLGAFQARFSRVHEVNALQHLAPGLTGRDEIFGGFAGEPPSEMM